MFGTLILIGALAIDGDTLRAEQGRIRLWGIDAPELREDQGPMSKVMLQRLVDQSQYLACHEMGRDRYGRIVARCLDDMGVDIACLMIAMEQADEWNQYSRGFYRGCYVEG
jgi:endonuclease YncB( thermonuclease family)